MPKPSDVFSAALCRCPALVAEPLENFLGRLLDEDLEVLAQLPGTPGQVLAAQFAYYARSSVTLAESLRRDAKHFTGLADTVRRLQALKKSKRRQAHADPSHSETATGQ